MPLVRIDVTEHLTPEARTAWSSALQQAAVNALDGVPAGDCFQVFRTCEPGDAIFDDSFPDVDRKDLVLIQVTMAAGQSAQSKQQYYREVVTSLGELGVRPDDIFIAIVENTPDDWFAGKLATP